MAWKKPTTQPKKSDAGFPGLKSHRGSTTKYEELQQNELIALDAIYGEDFKRLKEAHSAWKKSEPSFDIRISASDEDFSCTLRVILTATYPKSLPLITLLGDLRDATRFKIEKFLQAKPKELASEEQEMMHPIIEGIRDILEDDAQAKASGRQISLEEERARHEAMLARQAQEEKEELKRKDLEKSREEERAMAGAVQEELRRHEEAARAYEKSQGRRASEALVDADASKPDKDDNIVIFDRICRVVDISGKEFSFTTVECGSVFASGPLSAAHHCLPSVSKASSCPPLALKKTVLRFPTNQGESVRNQMIALEGKLTMLQGIHHRHLVDVVGFMIHEELAVEKNFLHRFWTVQVLNQKAQMTSLEGFLDICDRLHISKVRSFARDLLDAMACLHNHGIIHHDVHPRNVLIFKESTGEATQTVAKLSDAVYQHMLYDIAKMSDSETRFTSSRSSFWLAPETAAEDGKDQYTHKTDIWDLGVIIMQMMFGFDIVQQFSSPYAFMKAHSLSTPLKEMMAGFFDPDPKRRPKAFDLGCTEFLTTDAPIFAVGTLVSQRSRLQSFTSSVQQLPPRLGLDGTKEGRYTGRYEAEFIEEGRLGKGGFGQVVKARKKLDGGVFAIKIIRVSTSSTLTEVLKEVALISKLNHPAVVRYYDAWVDAVADSSAVTTDDEDDDDTGSTEVTESEQGPVTASGGLDFISSTGYPGIEIEFGYDSGEGADEDVGTNGRSGSSQTLDVDETEEDTQEEEQSSTSHNQLQRTHSQAKVQRILYISMEYCDRRTLRDLINGGLYKDTPEIWRLLRQILSGLRHIHSLSIVHRDLKPENILITQGLKGEDCVKIADFGLATMGQFMSTKPGATSSDPDQITRSLGTKLYTAPEVRSTASGAYSSKVDMFSLGVILFEMCYHPMLGMERVLVLEGLRRPDRVLPSDFKPGDRNQTEIILSLVAHNPEDRPDSATLLRSAKIPIDGEEEITRSILAGGVEPDSPYYREILSTFFSGFAGKARDYAWDIEMPGPAVMKKIMTDDLPLQAVVKENLETVFRRHGGLAINRSNVYPRSRHYGDNVVKLLNADGTVLQLPYDLTMGLARLLAKHPETVPADKVYSFGPVFRASKGMGQPVAFGEVDFDIVSSDARELSIKEAELLKVLDEAIHTLPPTVASKMTFWIGHSNLLHAIFDFCKVDRSLRRKTADIISKLHIHGCTWQKIRQELRSEEVGVSATSVNELEKFDFKGPPSETFSKLKDMFKGSDLYSRVAATIGHLEEVVEYSNRMAVKTTLELKPLCSIRESFYSGGILFTCTFRAKAKEVFAAGGRYDSLIKEFRLNVGDREQEGRRAVGFSFSWHSFVHLFKSGSSSSASQKRPEQEALQAGRLDVLVTSTDDSLRRTIGVEILGTLWDNGFTAELANSSGSTDGLLFNVKDDDYSWVVVVKPDKSLRVRTMKRNDIPDEEMPTNHLLTWLHSKVQERDSLASRSRISVQREHSGPLARRAHGGQEVSVLVTHQKNKKMMRQSVIDQAQSSAAGFLDAVTSGPILGVETSDGALTLIQSTPLSSVDGWKKLEQAAGSGGKGYVRQIHEELSTWRAECEEEKRSRHCFIYNFRTGKIIYFDLAI